MLVNDVVKRQLTLLDPALGGTRPSSPTRRAALRTRTACAPAASSRTSRDSTLFVDPAGLSMFVIDPAGKIARVASVPRSQDAAALGSNLLGNPGARCEGPPRLSRRLRADDRRSGHRDHGRQGRRSGNAAARAASMASMFEQPDTAALVRVDLATRKLDTAGFFKIPKNEDEHAADRQGMYGDERDQPAARRSTTGRCSPTARSPSCAGRTTTWTSFTPTASTASSPKIPYDWQRLTDEDKVAIIDSAKAAFERARAAAPNGGNAVMAGPGRRRRSGGMVIMNFSTRVG